MNHVGTTNSGGGGGAQPLIEFELNEPQSVCHTRNNWKGWKREWCYRVELDRNYIYKRLRDKRQEFKDKITWALNPFPNGITTNVVRTLEKNVKQIRAEAKAKEKEWGNHIIGDKNNPNWTTRFGEGLVADVLRAKGKNPRKPDKKGGYLPDWETDEYIWEVKTRNWTTTGTAGEKVFGVMYKYSDIPKLYNKPLKVVCVAYQEHELTFGNTKIFGNVSENKKAYLKLAKEQRVEFVKFSDLVSD